MMNWRIGCLGNSYETSINYRKPAPILSTSIRQLPLSPVFTGVDGGLD
jgi:hypothetical protein